MKKVTKLILILFFIPQINFCQTDNIDLKKSWSNLSSTLIRRNDLINKLQKITKESKLINQENFNKTASTANKFTQHLRLMKRDDKNAILLASRYNDQIVGDLADILSSLDKDPVLTNKTSYIELLPQIEGAENRIFVEIKSYNEMCQKASRKDLKFDSKNQKEIPKVEF